MANISEKDLKSIIPLDDNLGPARILILCPDTALAPQAASEAWATFKNAGCVVEFATENGEVPKGDPRLLERSAFRNIIGSTPQNIEQFYSMAGSDEYLNPRSWSEPGFSLLPYDAVYLSTGFDTRLRQFLESESLHRLMATYFPLTKRRRPVQRVPTGLDKLQIKRRSTTHPSEQLPKTIIEKHREELSLLEGPRKVVGAIGKGVLVLTKSMVVDNLTQEERSSLENECSIRAEAERGTKKVEEVKKKRLSGISLQRSATTGSIFKSSRRSKEQIVDTQDPIPSDMDHINGVTPSRRSVLYGVETTTAPTWMEHVGTRLSRVYGLKGMFKTYNMSTQDQVLKAVGNPSMFHAGPPNLKPFTHSAATHHYVSARYPIDTELTSLKMLEEIANARREWGKSRVE